MSTHSFDEAECSVCDYKFNLENEGGVRGEFGILPVAFCPTCLSCAIDMALEVAATGTVSMAAFRDECARAAIAPVAALINDKGLPGQLDDDGKDPFYFAKAVAAGAYFIADAMLVARRGEGQEV